MNFQSFLSILNKPLCPALPPPNLIFIFPELNQDHHEQQLNFFLEFCNNLKILQLENLINLHISKWFNKIVIIFFFICPL